MSEANLDVYVERERQKKAFTEAHDDGHAADDFLHLVGRQVQAGLSVDSEWGKRQRLVKIAALALAGIESYDRRCP